MNLRKAVTLWVLFLTAALTIAADSQSPAGDASNAPRITLEEFKKLLATQDVIPIDVRTTDSYREGHIPGAISMPLDTIPSHESELKKFNKPIVTYCG